MVLNLENEKLSTIWFEASLMRFFDNFNKTKNPSRSQLFPHCYFSHCYLKNLTKNQAQALWVMQ